MYPLTIFLHISAAGRSLPITFSACHPTISYTQTDSITDLSLHIKPDHMKTLLLNTIDLNTYVGSDLNEQLVL